MVIYSTFFLCKPQELLAGFPGSLPPLAQPVRREFRNPFTKQVSVLETREPEWPDGDVSQFKPNYMVVAGRGSYEDYLESRLPPFVRGNRHWCAKGLTGIELEELGAELIVKLISLDNSEMDVVAEAWAKRVSAPEFTHSSTGKKLHDGMTAHQAMAILRSLVTLAKSAEPGMSMYLLIEA